MSVASRVKTMMPINFTAHFEALAEESARWRALAFVDHVRVLLRYFRSLRLVGVVVKDCPCYCNCGDVSVTGRRL